jgi:membrane-associated phospholipid phosphatase
MMPQRRQPHERFHRVSSWQRLDDRLLFAVNSFARHTAWLHEPMLAYAKYGVVLFAALLLAGLVAARHRGSSALASTAWAALAALLALGLNQPIGHLFAEARPYVTHPQILRLADVTTDFSFPSDHAVMAGAVAAGLLLAHRRLGTLASVAALVLAFARVFIAAHYPWDVAGGLVLGAVAAVGGWLLLRRPLTAITGWARTLPVLRHGFGLPDGADLREAPLQRANP